MKNLILLAISKEMFQSNIWNIDKQYLYKNFHICCINYSYLYCEKNNINYNYIFSWDTFISNKLINLKLKNKIFYRIKLLEYFINNKVKQLSNKIKQLNNTKVPICSGICAIIFFSIFFSHIYKEIHLIGINGLINSGSFDGKQFNYYKLIKAYYKFEINKLYLKNYLKNNNKFIYKTYKNSEFEFLDNSPYFFTLKKNQINIKLNNNKFISI